MSYKELTSATWKEPDPPALSFARESRVLGAVVAMDGDDWARQFLAVKLKEHIPEQVRELFAVARDSALYGWFYYPLFYLGGEQLHRVMESAARVAYRQLGGTMRNRTSLGSSTGSLTAEQFTVTTLSAGTAFAGCVTRRHTPNVNRSSVRLRCWRCSRRAHTT